MPKNSQRVYATQRIRVSKTAEAPARYAFEWLTDYREDDGRLSRRAPSFTVLRIGDRQLVRVRKVVQPNGELSVALELIRVTPPTRWHVDQIDDDDLETVDYAVRSSGPKRCRIELRIVERWMVPKHPSAAEVRARAERFWDRIVGSLEEDYREGRPPVG